MIRTFALRTAAALALAAVGATGAMAADEAPHWGYDGDTGPEAWGDLSADWAACSDGQQQSPVDLSGGIRADLPDLSPGWADRTGWVAADNGHTVKLSPEGEAGSIEIDGKDYALIQFHFHHRSEHAIDGERYPMEAHFVHQADDGTLAVLGVMLEGGGTEDDALSRIMQTVGEAGADPVDMGAMNPADFLPDDGGFYRYEGSLTTPPCSEVVVWTVMSQPVQVSDAAIAAFADRYEDDARPLQPLNRRFLLTN